MNKAQSIQRIRLAFYTAVLRQRTVYAIHQDFESSVARALTPLESCTLSKEIASAVVQGHVVKAILAFLWT
jgi:hypothetical protein